MMYPLDGETTGTHKRLQQILRENILPYWSQRLAAGARGFHLSDDDGHGDARPPDRYLVTQARTLWFYSHLAQTPYGEPSDRDRARYGFEYLHDTMWDRSRGGFYWQMDAHGAPIKTCKHLYGQAFGLFGLIEYYRLSHDPTAGALASDLCELIETRAHDATHGGYVEAMTADWRPLQEGTQTYLGVPSGLKLMNTHLHLMEALSLHLEVLPSSLVRERVVELIEILEKKVCIGPEGVGQDQHERDWTPVSGRNCERVSFGHDLERMWLILASRETAGLPVAAQIDTARSVFAYALRHGFDERRGGFFESGRLGRDADRRDKIWWVQAEALLFCAELFFRTGDASYSETFSRSLEWITDHQIDWHGGEWHNTITSRGRRKGEKAGAWKSPFHNGRAILTCLELIDRQKVGGRDPSRRTPVEGCPG
jgi:mannobiose 2-epimerase